MFWLWACKRLVAIKFCFRAIVLNLRLAHDQADRDAGNHALQVGSSGRGEPVYAGGLSVW
jgi:hypothetical protein